VSTGHIPDAQTDMLVIDILDEPAAPAEVKCRDDLNLADRYTIEVNEIMRVSADTLSYQHYQALQLSMQFGFLVASLSRSVLDVTKLCMIGWSFQTPD
jgi:hypothetical protein